MTDTFLFGRLRALLHDTGRGMATASHFYSDKALLRALNDAQGMLVRTLIEKGDAELTLSRLIKTCPANGGRTGLDVPSDYLLPICGTSATGKYMTAEDIRTGEALSYISPNRVYVRGGQILGPSTSGDLMVYYSSPPEIKITGSNLTAFSDAFYNTVKFIAAHSAIVEEDRDALDRFTALQKEWMAKIKLLK
jgi:hypothetical protein